MWLHNLLLLAMAALGLSTMAPMSMCASETSSTTGSPGCTVTYTPFMAPQIGPTTTIYAAIMTTYFYVIDCHYCTVTNVDNNPSPQGPFTAKTTSSLLTITRVECMPETTAVTRRNYHGYDDKEETQISTAKPRELVRGSDSHIERRQAATQASSDLMDFATSFSSNISPDVSLLNGPARQSLTEIWSAMFALDIADSGMNVSLACAQVQTTEVRYQLLQSDFDPDKVKALLCWIASNGYDFNTTRADIYATLQTAAWGLEVSAGFNTSRSAICDDVGLFQSIGPYLGINTQQWEGIVCSGIPSSTPTPSDSNGATPTGSAASNGVGSGGSPPYGYGNATNFGSAPTAGFGTAGFGNPTAGGTGTPGAVGNSTTWGTPIAYSGTIGNYTQATGSGAASDAPMGQYGTGLLKARLPPSPTASLFYPVGPTTTRHSLYKRY